MHLVENFIKIDKLDWFPENKVLFSDEIYIYPWSINLQGDSVGSAQLIFAKPSENMVYYTSVYK